MDFFKTYSKDTKFSNINLSFLDSFRRNFFLRGFDPKKEDILHPKRNTSQMSVSKNNEGFRILNKV